jgi:hypothetical protein
MPLNIHVYSNLYYLSRIVVALHIRHVSNLPLIWFVKLKHMHGNVWNVRHVQNVEIPKMIQNFYFVTIVIGKSLSHILHFVYLLFVLVVITCIVVHRLYQKHLRAIGDVNYATLSLANFDLDLFVICCFYIYIHICLYVQSVEHYMSVYLFVLKSPFLSLFSFCNRV